MFSRLSGRERHAANYPVRASAGSTPVAFLGHYVLGLQLFDALAWTLAVPASPLPAPAIPRTLPAPKLPQTLEKVLCSLRDWPALVSDATDLHASFSQRVNSRNRTKNTSAGHKAVDCALGNIQLALVHRNKGAFHKLLYHIHSLAFIITWFSPACAPTSSTRNRH